MKFHLCPIPFFKKKDELHVEVPLGLNVCSSISRFWFVFCSRRSTLTRANLAHSVHHLLTRPAADPPDGLGNLHCSCFNVPPNPPQKNLTGDSSQCLDVTSFHSLQLFHRDVVFTESKLHSGDKKCANS